MITNPRRGLLTTIKVNTGPRGTRRELWFPAHSELRETKRGHGPWVGHGSPGRQQPRRLPRTAGQRVASGGQLTAPRCCRRKRSPSTQAVSPVGKHCRGSASPAQERQLQPARQGRAGGRSAARSGTFSIGTTALLKGAAGIFSPCPPTQA